MEIRYVLRSVIRCRNSSVVWWLHLPGAQQPTPVTGAVFEDANGNGRRDTGERGLGGVAVSNQHEVVQTAADGTYTLPRTGYWRRVRQRARWLPDGRTLLADRPLSGAREPVDFALRPHATQPTFTFIHASDTHVSKQSAPRCSSCAHRGCAASRFRARHRRSRARRASRRRGRGARATTSFIRGVGRFPVPVWSVPGNHENFGIERHLSLVSPAHPLYGKGMYRSAPRAELLLVHLWRRAFRRPRLGRHRRPLVLRPRRFDSACVAPGGPAPLPPGMPVVTFNHIPFVSAVDAVSGYRDEGRRRR